MLFVCKVFIVFYIFAVAPYNTVQFWFVNYPDVTLILIMSVLAFTCLLCCSRQSVCLGADYLPSLFNSEGMGHCEPAGPARIHIHAQSPYSQEDIFRGAPASPSVPPVLGSGRFREHPPPGHILPRRRQWPGVRHFSKFTVSCSFVF